MLWPRTDTVCIVSGYKRVVFVLSESYDIRSLGKKIVHYQYDSLQDYWVEVDHPRGLTDMT